MDDLRDRPTTTLGGRYEEQQGDYNPYPGIVIARSEGGISNTALTEWRPGTPSLVKIFSTPVIGTKDGSYFIRCAGTTRNNADTSDIANVLILDGDSHINEDGEIIPGAPNPELVHRVLTGLGVLHHIYSSHSNGEKGDDYHKYRVIIPCAYSPEQLPTLLDYLFDALHRAGVMLAPVKENRAWSQAWYFPRVPDEERKALFKFYHSEGVSLDAETLSQAWLKNKPQPETIEPQPSKQKPIDETNGRRNPLKEFNQTYDVQDVLIRNGYLAKGLKYLRPSSESKIPADSYALTAKTA